MTDKARHLYEATRKQKLTADSRRKDSVLLCRSSPSDMTWYSLQDAGLVTPFEGFIKALPLVTVGMKDIPTDTKYSEMATHVQEANQLILSVCMSRNEAFSLIIASNLLGFAENCFEKDFSSKFSFSVLPVVYPVQTDHRKDKESDFVMVRIKNKRTIVVIELKSTVSAGFGDGDKDPLSQLFYEMYVVCQEEGKNYKDLIGIYGNYCTRHLFLMDCSVIEKFSGFITFIT